jgi:hypothetical protein
VAARIDPVGQDDDRFMRSGALRQTSRGCGGSVVQRSGAKWFEIVETVFKAADSCGERLALVKPSIEREEREFVLAVAELRKDGIEGLPRDRDLRADAHAAAHVDENRDTDRRSEIRSQRQDRPRLAVVSDLEIGCLQAWKRPPVLVADRRLNADKIHGAAKCRPRLIRLGLPLQGTHSQPGDDGRCDCRSRE